MDSSPRVSAATAPVPPAPAPTGSSLTELSRKEIVELAKKHGIKANLKSSLIVAELQKLSEFGKDGVIADAKDSSNSIGAAADALSSAREDSSSGLAEVNGNIDAVVLENGSPPKSALSSRDDSQARSGKEVGTTCVAAGKNGSASGTSTEATAPTAATSPSPQKGKKASTTGSGSSIPAWKVASRDFRANNNKSASSAAAAFGHTTSPIKSRLPPPPVPPAPPAFKANTKRQKDLPLSPRNQAQMAKYRERQQIARRELDAPPQAAFGHASHDTQSRVPPSPAKEKVVPFKANTKKQKVMELSERNKRQMEKFRERQRMARSGETKKAAFGHGTQTTKSRIPLGTAPNGSGGGGGSTSGGDASTMDDTSSLASASSSQSSSTAGVKGKKKAVPAWKVASRDFRRKPAAAQAAGQAKSTAAAFGHGVSETKSRVPIYTPSSSGGDDDKETVKAFRANTRKLKTMEMTERNRKQMEKFRKRQMAGREERMKKAAQEKEIMCSRD